MDTLGLKVTVRPVVEFPFHYIAFKGALPLATTLNRHLPHKNISFIQGLEG